MSDISKAVTEVCQALIVDESYRRGWQANIAMAFYDEFRRHYPETMTHEKLHQISNAAATNFLSQLCETQVENLYPPEKDYFEDCERGTCIHMDCAEAALAEEEIRDREGHE